MDDTLTSDPRGSSFDSERFLLWSALTPGDNAASGEPPRSRLLLVVLVETGDVRVAQGPQDATGGGRGGEAVAAERVEDQAERAELVLSELAQLTPDTGIRQSSH